MNRMIKKIKWALPLALLLAFLTSIVAFAITIIIDGTRESAWNGGGSISDDGGNEIGIRDQNDIDRIQYTNDTTYYYFLIDTFANTIWNNPFGLDPSFYICLNVDNDTGTGTGGLTQCSNGAMTGIDFIIEILGGPTLALNIYDDNFNSVTDTDKQVAFLNDITEVRVTASAIGLTSANCLATMPTAFYFDNGIADNEDSTPDNGTVNIGCGAPTAVTLTDLTVRNGGSMIAIGVAGVLLLGSAFILLRLRKPTTY